MIIAGWQALQHLLKSYESIQDYEFYLNALNVINSVKENCNSDGFESPFDHK